MNMINFKIDSTESKPDWKKRIQNEIQITARKVQEKNPTQAFGNQKRIISKDLILFLSARSMLGALEH